MDIFALYTVIAVILYLILGYRVMHLRYRYQVELGDGGHDELNRAIRTHANFAENVPFLLIIMFLIAQTGPFNAWLHLFGTVMILGRLLHAWGLIRTSGWSWQRATGTLLTQLLMLAGALFCLWAYMPLAGFLAPLSL